MLEDLGVFLRIPFQTYFFNILFLRERRSSFFIGRGLEHDHADYVHDTGKIFDADCNR